MDDARRSSADWDLFHAPPGLDKDVLGKLPPMIDKLALPSAHAQLQKAISHLQRTQPPYIVLVDLCSCRCIKPIE